MSKGTYIKVIAVGNVGNIETRPLPSGSSITNLTIATNETWKDKQSGQQQERTEWHRVVLFNNLADIAQRYVRKGSKVLIEGKLRTRKWVDSQNIERYTTEIVADEMQMLESPRGAAEGDSSDQPSRPQPAPAPGGGGGGGPSDFDDDIPFNCVPSNLSC